MVREGNSQPFIHEVGIFQFFITFKFFGIKNNHEAQTNGFSIKISINENAIVCLTFKPNN